MFFRSLGLVWLLGLMVTAGSMCAHAQSTADNKASIVPKTGDDERDDRPKGIKESLEKMRIDKEKKEHGEMLGRGEEALKISEQLEAAFVQNGKLSEKEYSKVATVEKIVKKIRSDLGGDDGDEEKDQVGNRENKYSPADAVKSLRSTTIALFDELKKTTRFTISAAAIQTSNAVLKLARFLRISK